MAGQPRTRAKKALDALEKEQAKPNATDGLDVGTADAPADAATATNRDRPPRRSRAQKSSATPSASVADDRRPLTIRKIEDSLTQTFVIAGLGVSMFDQFDGQVIATNADRLARCWADLAQQSPMVRKALQSLLAGSAWGAAIGGTAMVAVPILVRHGYAPMNLAAIAASNGVNIPIIEEPEPIARPNGAGAVGPEVPADVPPSDEVRNHAAAKPRHPMDGTPAEGHVIPPEDVQFPHNPDDVGRGRDAA
jgi:hypothetical protein